MIKEQVYMEILKPLVSVKSIIAFIGITFSTYAYSQEAILEPVAVFEKWGVFVVDQPKNCWATSKPERSINTRDGRKVNVKRGAIVLHVNFRPDDKVYGQVTFTGGYPFAEGSNVNFNVDGTNFALFTEDEWAWARSDEDDAKIVNAMKKGAKAILTAKSSRGTQTEDTFSLLGFTAAVGDAEKRCK